MHDKELNQLYLAVKGRGILYQNQYIGTFTDGSAHIVLTNEFRDKETLKIKIGQPVHLNEYIDIIEPVGLNETGLIKALPCPQCGYSEVTIVNNSDSEVNGIHCVKCPLAFEDCDLNINRLISLWNNILRKENF